MKRIISTVFILGALMLSSNAANRYYSTNPGRRPHLEKELRRSIRDSLRTGRYYPETTVRILPRTEQTPKGLKSRRTTLFMRPAPQKSDSTNTKTSTHVSI